ncbi:hypothetical protein GCM10011494_02930 [Novosphingobium endophyticum]|uniref:Integrase DNA-binding domain-containing protein n=1 Tax=Novosphingobium endophyticum TaxID=1955250 RepID=A0A916TRR6_9SPHN|nr:hypothetical protein GCM10011494_02930 [Novosphingobium endophyticum]
MALSFVAINAAKPRAKPYKLSDGAGLYLLVTPGGGRLWRMNYRFGGKQKTLALGLYPDVSAPGLCPRRPLARACENDAVLV